MIRRVFVAFAILGWASLGAHGEESYSAKTADTAIPAEIKDEIKKGLSEKAVQFLEAKGGLICEVWFAKSLPSKASAEKAKKGLVYSDVPESTIVGALKVSKEMGDYKKQKIKPGVYVLRLGFQPANGDHMGTAPNPDFVLLTPAAEEKDAEPIKTKELQELSAKVGGSSHPAIFLLMPTELKDAADTPKVINRGEGHFALTLKLPVKAGDDMAELAIGLVLVGVSTAA